MLTSLLLYINNLYVLELLALQILTMLPLQGHSQISTDVLGSKHTTL